MPTLVGKRLLGNRIFTQFQSINIRDYLLITRAKGFTTKNLADTTLIVVNITNNELMTPCAT